MLSTVMVALLENVDVMTPDDCTCYSAQWYIVHVSFSTAKIIFLSNSHSTSMYLKNPLKAAPRKVSDLSRANFATVLCFLPKRAVTLFGEGAVVGLVA
jgi:hypothetical protein